MSTRAAAKSKNKKPLDTTLGKAPASTGDDPIDLSHLRKPIDTSIFGLSQVLQLYETATDEVRRYVTYECDIMYECRMCRTIFRSLANFILHKRNYCRDLYNPNDHTNCRNRCQENELHVVEEETDSSVSISVKEQNSGTSSPIPPKCDSNKSAEVKENRKKLSYVLRRLQGRQESSLITEQCLSEDISNESKSSEKEEIKNNVALEKINHRATSSVFQTMFNNMINEYKGDMMKTEVMEIHNILENNEAILGSDGKIISSESEKYASFTCSVCNQKFSTRKTLIYHIKYKHNNTRLVYQCPECNDIFANAWSVFRHLYKVHRKTTAQVKRLRNQIHANIIRRGEQPDRKNENGKIDSEAVSDLQEKANLENQQWMDDLEGDNDLQRCGGCGRKFERKAALHSHSQFCSKRIEVVNSIKDSAKRTQSEKTKTSKTSNSTNTDTVIKGSRRRKQLISQKMCRVDYVKDYEIFKNSSSGDVVNHCETDLIIEVQDDNDENSEAVEKEKITKEEVKACSKLLLTEEAECVSRSESRCSEADDVIYVDTIKLSPPPPRLKEESENIDLMEEVIPRIPQNNIVTRSMKNSQAIHENEPNDDLVTPNEINFETVTQGPEQLPSNKRKETDPQPGNSKRKKIETNTPPKITLEIKSLKYVDKEKHSCIPCKKTFKSNKSLMKHMAIHFNWFRYQCSKCSYMSYSRSRCDRHVEIKHAIYNIEDLDNIIFHLPNSKTVAKSTEFSLRNKKCKLKKDLINKTLITLTPEDKSLRLCNDDDTGTEENKEKTIKEKELPVLENSVERKVSTDQEEPSVEIEPVQDPSLRKMIMEVIFGSQDQPSPTQEAPQQNLVPLASLKDCESSKVVKNTEDAPEGFLGFRNPTEPENPTLSSAVGVRDNTRPIRNRVPTVQKDFLYDMAQILKPKPSLSSHKEDVINKKEKQKASVKTKEAKSKHSSTMPVVAISKKVVVNKSAEPVVQQQCAELVQDINMNSEDLNKHVTGEFC